LRLRLRLLRFDGSDKLQYDSENLLPGETTVLEDSDIQSVGIDSEKTCISPSEAELSPVQRLPFSEIGNVDIVSTMLNDISCQEKKRGDLL
ncbi:hypothetical protein KI387_026013, partial [Taxus chinensis]